MTFSKFLLWFIYMRIYQGIYAMWIYFNKKNGFGCSMMWFEERVSRNLQTWCQINSKRNETKMRCMLCDIRMTHYRGTITIVKTAIFIDVHSNDLQCVAIWSASFSIPIKMVNTVNKNGSVHGARYCNTSSSKIKCHFHCKSCAMHDATQGTIHAEIHSFHFKRHHRRHSTCMQTNMPYN